MKSKRLLSIISGLLLAALIAIAIYFCCVMTRVEQFKSAALQINGEIIDGTTVTAHRDWAELPLLVVFNQLGAEIEWDTDAIANIAFNEKQYVLSLADERSFKQLGTDDDWLIPAPGNSMFVCEAITKDVVLDDTTLRWVFRWSGTHLNIDIDYENAIVSIQSEPIDPFDE